MADGSDASSVSAAHPDNANNSQVTYLKDYQAPAYLIDRTDLVFDLQADKTLVHSRLSLRKNPSALQQGNLLELDGDKLLLTAIAVDGQALDASAYEVLANGLRLMNMPDVFTLEISTEIEPEKNLSLEGLYLSDGMYCTQCEAEGFRRITYYLDRPDVMSVFTTTIMADASQYPILLSNGNLQDSGQTEDGRHWAKWLDPFKKPAYLFALVAGNLQCVEDTFITQSSRSIALKIYVEAKDLDKCDHAMQSLKNAMRWDEESYGREYDLDLYMIVAVDFFNMGAMENKGLNIFNTSCVLANPRTQTDLAFQRVEAVVAHEYFHNWSGNRVTCRDWFQLSLKEGFTVFRDACFSADMNSPTVKRIEDVNLLRSAQFAEDGGPMSHPVRPESYIEISNFYTLTIYEKGAEVIRMMVQLLGEKAFRAGSDLYFERHDGQAVTCEDFVQAMEQASGVDLSQFRLWYSQSGTPVLMVEEVWDADAGVYTLTIEQSCPPTPGQDNKQPFIIPVRVGLVTQAGMQTIQSDSSAILTPANYDANKPQECLLALSLPKQSWRFNGLSEKPVPSLLRGFSAPVKLHFNYSRDDLLKLLAADDDGFVRWDAAQRYAIDLIAGHVTGALLIDSHEGAKAVKAFGNALGELLQAGFDQSDEQATAVWRSDHDAALTAEILRLPGYQTLLEHFQCVNISAIQSALEALRKMLATQLKVLVRSSYTRLNDQLVQRGEYQPKAEDIALRSLKNTCLAYLMAVDDPSHIELAHAQYRAANNMTDQSSALTALVNCQYDGASKVADQCLDDFYQQWSQESLVVNQWFTIQACSENPGALQRVKKLMSHPAYDDTNPNKVRALIGAFCMRNLPQFHADFGKAYGLLVDEIVRLNSVNPQLASRLLAPLTQWRRYSSPQRELMFEALTRIADTDNLSADVFEVVSKSRAD